MTHARAVRVALALWITLAFLVWNVVFDRMIVLAGRAYVYAAANAARTQGTFLLINDWMAPAVRRGVLSASLASGLVLTIGLAGIAVAVRRNRFAERHGEELP